MQICEVPIERGRARAAQGSLDANDVQSVGVDLSLKPLTSSLTVDSISGRCMSGFFHGGVLPKIEDGSSMEKNTWVFEQRGR